MITIIDYGMGNTGSILNMLRKLGTEATLSADPAVLRNSTGLILPGVGAFDHGMQNIHDRGLIEVLNDCVLHRRIPILGICLGMQLFARRSEEGERPGLGWIAADVRRFRFEPPAPPMRIPHMGWNEIRIAAMPTLESDSPAGRLFAQCETNARFYFVHTYHACCDEPGDVLATARYGYEFTAAMGRGHIVGTQFHPEKSLRFGLRLMQNFVDTTRRSAAPLSPT